LSQTKSYNTGKTAASRTNSKYCIA